MMKSTFRLLVILAFWLPFQDHCDAQGLLLESLRDSLVRSAMFPSEVEIIEPSDGQGGSGPTMDQAMISFLKSLYWSILRNDIDSSLPAIASSQTIKKDSSTNETIGTSHHFRLAELQVSNSFEWVTSECNIDRISVQLTGTERLSHVSHFQCADIGSSVSRQNQDFPNRWVTTYTEFSSEENVTYTDSFYWENGATSGNKLWLEIVEHLHSNGVKVHHDYRNYHYIWFE